MFKAVIEAHNLREIDCEPHPIAKLSDHTVVGQFE